jgi:hypothetical protein
MEIFSAVHRIVFVRYYVPYVHISVVMSLISISTPTLSPTPNIIIKTSLCRLFVRIISFLCSHFWYVSNVTFLHILFCTKINN